MDIVSFKNTVNTKELIKAYVSHKCFDDNHLNQENPYQRPIRRNDLDKIDFTFPITSNNLFENKNLILNKLLLTVYEQDLLFLDEKFSMKETKIAFKQFYNPDFVALGKSIKPELERLIFGFLEDEIEVIGDWNKEKLVNYFMEIIAEQEQHKSELCESIANAQDPALMAKMLLIQMAPDFLSEASAMARVLPGNYGLEQSEIMKVFIDEYGYGVHHKKHSTLFEKTLESVGMNKGLHYYYDSYLPTSLMLVNYFHYICSNKNLWFRYLGALYYTEASIPHFNKQLSAMLNKYIPGIDTEYFDEHVHIDRYHRRMVLDKLIAVSVDKYGADIIDEILLGFESFRLLQSFADQDLIAQIRFVENMKTTKNYAALGEKKVLIESKQELTSAHIHEKSEMFTVIDGELSFNNNGVRSFALRTGESIVIPKGRVHGTIINSEHAKYSVEAIITE